MFFVFAGHILLDEVLRRISSIRSKPTAAVNSSIGPNYSKPRQPLHLPHALPPSEQARSHSLTYVLRLVRNNVICACARCRSGWVDMWVSSTSATRCTHLCYACMPPAFALLTCAWGVFIQYISPQYNDMRRDA